ncbi:hypothetical protein [Ferrovibrio sp.]|uniref:hypothetical protein n=1 Tax=Ferrovibrio sp. TaxID=1917215 RepID=UPI0035B0F010
MIREPYEGLREQRQQIRLITSSLIGRYIDAISLRIPTDDNNSVVEIALDELTEVLLLKQITRDYIISNPALAAQQRGQSLIITELFNEIYTDIENEAPTYLPHRFLHFLDDKTASHARKVADCISSLTEAEAIALHARLKGHVSGSVLDPIVR